MSPYTMSSNSMDSVHWIHGYCPVWLILLNFVHGLSGLCPEYPWTLSRLSTESMVNVHSGQCPGSPLSPWTFYRHFCHEKICLLGLWAGKTQTDVLVYLVPMVSCPRRQDTTWYLVPRDTLPWGRMSAPGLSCPRGQDTIGTVSCPQGHFTLG